MYDVILASPEALLEPWSWFWQHIVRNKKTSSNVTLLALSSTKRM